MLEETIEDILEDDTMRSMRVIELFAGVGGFRVGLERAGGYKVVWSNQWEPGTEVQHASDIYVRNFGFKHHSNEDISVVPTKEIPEHDLLVGGFPCQDYSVARTLSHAAGIIGKKGVLWWQIHRIIKESQVKPSYLMLENVDRLLKSPAKQRGRDFALMLASLSEQGYIAEWRVINAADYGMPQRRRRVFILGYRKGTPIYEKIKADRDNYDWLLNSGTIAKGFPVIRDHKNETTFELKGTLAEISERFPGKVSKSPFDNTGIIINGKVYTVHTKPDYSGTRTILSDLLLKESQIPAEYFIDSKDIKRWKYFKGAKNEPRKAKNGHTYNYSEGSMAFPDPVNKPARTIITGEGGKTPSRFKHVIKTPSGRFRRLTPLELERINMFPDNHTAGVSDTRRAFFMGNALVVGIVEKLGKALTEQAKRTSRPTRKELAAA
jgi:DNA (cytosine-5)-methyltransferase 1